MINGGDVPTPAAAPDQCGIASGAVADFLDAVEGAGLDPHSLIVMRHGQVAAAGWWAPYRPDDIALLYSLSKSVTATAVGFAVHEGLLDLDATLASYFPRAHAGPRARQIRIRHLLAMATGHETDTLARLDPGDVVGSFLAIEPDEEPGQLFTYHNGGTLMLSAALTARTGADPGTYLQPRLFDPLGVRRWHWQRVGGYQQGFSGLHLTTGAIARFGQTYLAGGRFAGRQVLPEGWAALATAKHTDNAGRAANVDWQQGYGFQFWRARHGYRGDGAYGQFCLVLPEHDLMLAATDATEDMQGYLDLVWQILLPGISHGPLPADPGGAARLADRLASLRLPAPDGATVGAVGPVGTVGPASAVGPANTVGATAPATARPHGGGAAITGEPARTLGLSAATIAPAPGGQVLELVADGSAYRIPVTAGGFARSEHRIGETTLTLAACGGWQSRTRFVADVVLVNTPHRFRLTADAVTGAVDTRWHAAPLGALPLAAWAVPTPAG